MGTNARMAMIGDLSPTAATTKPSVAAMLYAGATDAVAITVLDISPSAPDLSPFSAGCSAGATAPLAVAILTPSDTRPAEAGLCAYRDATWVLRREIRWTQAEGSLVREIRF